MSILNQIVTNGLCIGCGLCESLAGAERVRMVMTPEGRERPIASIPLDMVTNARIQAVCPGTQIHGMPAHAVDPEADHDDVWGSRCELRVGMRQSQMYAFAVRRVAC